MIGHGLLTVSSRTRNSYRGIRLFSKCFTYVFVFLFLGGSYYYYLFVFHSFFSGRPGGSFRAIPNSSVVYDFILFFQFCDGIIFYSIRKRRRLLYGQGLHKHQCFFSSKVQLYIVRFVMSTNEIHTHTHIESNRRFCLFSE